MCFLKFGACPLTVEKQAEQSLFTHSLLLSENGAMSTILPKSIPLYGVSMVVKSPVITYGSLHFNTVDFIDHICGEIHIWYTTGRILNKVCVGSQSS